MSLPLDEIRRLVSLLETHQGPDERKEVVSKLYDVLDPSSKGYGGSEAENAFIVAGGLGVVRLRIDCMEGDWMAEARNGTTDLLDKLARLPGLQATFDKVSMVKEAKVGDAIAAMHEQSHGGHGHGHSHGHGDGSSCGHAHSEGPVDPARLNLSGLHEELKGVRATEGGKEEGGGEVARGDGGS